MALWSDGPEVVRRAQRFAHVLFDQLIVAVIVEPDAVEILRVLDVAHGAEGHVDLAVAVVLFALLHLGREHADDGEQHAVQANGLAHRPCAGEELGLGLRPDDADVGALLVFGAVEEAALVGVELPDVLKDRPDAVHGPGVGVQIVLHRHVFLHLSARCG